MAVMSCLLTQIHRLLPALQHGNPILFSTVNQQVSMEIHPSTTPKQQGEMLIRRTVTPPHIGGGGGERRFCICLISILMRLLALQPDRICQ